MKIASGIVQMLDGIDDEFARQFLHKLDHLYKNEYGRFAKLSCNVCIFCKLFKCWTGLMMNLPGSFYANQTASTKMNRKETLLKNLPRLAPNEEETAAERCSEKLVDLVVLLTTKVVFDLVVVVFVVVVVVVVFVVVAAVLFLF